MEIELELLVLCENVLMVPPSGPIEGVRYFVNTVRPTHLPAQVGEFGSLYVYAQFSRLRRDIEAMLRVRCVETDPDTKPIWEGVQTHRKPPDFRQPSQMYADLSDLQLEESGEHRVEFLADGKLLGMRRLYVDPPRP